MQLNAPQKVTSCGSKCTANKSNPARHTTASIYDVTGIYRHIPPGHANKCSQFLCTSLPNCRSYLLIVTKKTECCLTMHKHFMFFCVNNCFEETWACNVISVWHYSTKLNRCKLQLLIKGFYKCSLPNCDTCPQLVMPVGPPGNNFNETSIEI